MQTKNHAFSLLNIKSVDEEKRVIEGIASTPAPDRVGDVVEPLGARFELPLPLLLDHNPRDQVGHVDFAQPTKAGIPFRATIRTVDEPGEVKTLVDKAWHLVKHGLRSAVSIGFRSIEHSFTDTGTHFTKWEWLELSLVSIPAQSEAVITSAKSLDGDALRVVRAADQAVRAGAGRTRTRANMEDDMPLPNRAEIRAADRRVQSRKFAEVAHRLMRQTAVGGGDPVPAALDAGVGRDIQTVLRLQHLGAVTKDAVAAMTGGDTSPLAYLNDMAGAFLSGPESSIFDSLLAEFVPGALHIRYGIGSSGVTGASVGRGEAIPVARMSFVEGMLESRRINAIIVLSRDLVRFGGPAAVAALESEMRKAVRITTDAVAVAVLATGAASVAATGAGPIGVRRDMREALTALTTGASSRLYWLLPVATAKRLSVASDVAGARAFPGMTPAGGELDGVPALVTDALTADGLLIDAGAFVAAADPTIELEEAQSAALEMDTAPSSASAAGSPPAPTASNLVSLFQTNSLAIKAMREIALAPLRAGAVRVTGIDELWGREGEGSPPLE